MTDPAMEPFVQHMEFFGYEIVREEKFVRARHARYFNLVMQYIGGGILFTSFTGHQPSADREKGRFLEAINNANKAVLVCRLYSDKDNDLVIEAWYPDSYDRAKFGAFIEKLNKDIMVAMGDEVGLLKYLK